jgi:hypothetical protein
MLALKQALSLPSIKTVGGWTPPSLSSLVAWYQNKVEVDLTGTDVSGWNDSSNNSYNMAQGTLSEQPAYDAATGFLTFISQTPPTVSTNLQTASQISLATDFTIAIRINTTTTNGAFLADNTSSNEFFKYSSSTRISIKIAGSSSTSLDLDSGTFGDDSLIITRASDVLTLWHNGVAQTGTTPTLAGTSLIDVIGLRETDKNGFDGKISEILIYNVSNPALTGILNLRLASL